MIFPLPPSKVLSYHVFARLSPAEGKFFNYICNYKKYSKSAFIRILLMKECRKIYQEKKEKEAKKILLVEEEKKKEKESQEQ